MDPTCILYKIYIYSIITYLKIKARNKNKFTYLINSLCIYNIMEHILNHVLGNLYGGLNSVYF